MQAQTEKRQFNVKLPSSLITAVKRRILQLYEEEAKKISTSDVVGRAILYYLGPFDSLGVDQAVWKAKVEKARVKVDKVIDGESFTVELSSEDVAAIFRQIRDSFEE